MLQLAQIALSVDVIPDLGISYDLVTTEIEHAAWFMLLRWPALFLTDHELMACPRRGCGK